MIGLLLRFAYEESSKTGAVRLDCTGSSLRAQQKKRMSLWSAVAPSQNTPGVGLSFNDIILQRSNEEL